MQATQRKEWEEVFSSLKNKNLITTVRNCALEHMRNWEEIGSSDISGVIYERLCYTSEEDMVKELMNWSNELEVV